MRFSATCGRLSHVTKCQICRHFFVVNIPARFFGYKNTGCYMKNNRNKTLVRIVSAGLLASTGALSTGVQAEQTQAETAVQKQARSQTSSKNTSLSDAELEAKKLVTVVVTASRVSEVQSELPVAVGVVEEEQLALDQGAHIQDSTRQVAGVTINQLSGSSSHNTGIRMPLNYDGYYLFLQDSVPLQSSAFFNHNGLRWSSYNTSADQIEILKGAGSTLHGSGAVAATVNVISAEPQFTPEGKVSLFAGEHGYLQGKVQHTDALNDSQAILFAASALKDDGWRDHTSRERQELLVKHLWELDANNELKTQFQFSTMTDEMATSLSEDDYRNNPMDSGLSDQVLATDPERKSDFLRLSTEWRHLASDKLEISVIPYYRHNTNDYTATWRSYTPYNESAVDSFGILSKGRYQHGNGGETVFGLDLEHSESENLSYQPIDVTVTSYRGTTTDYISGFKYRDATTTYLNASPYVQHNQRVGRNLMLSAGVRYDISRFELDNRLAATDNDGYGNRQLKNRSDDFTSLNPKLGMNYKLDRNNNIYGRVAQANRLPTASQLYNLKSGDSDSLLGGLEEETSTTYELGYRYLTQDLGLTLSVYRMNIDDAIVSANDDNGDSYRTNAGEVRHQGIELEMGVDISDQWSMDLAASRSEHKYIHYINSGTDYSGKHQKLGPEVKAAATLSWRAQSQPEPNLQLQVDHFGDYWMDDANTQKADNYTVFHLKAQYALQSNLKLFSRIDNLTDKKYSTQAEVSYGRSKFYPALPRTVKAGVQYQW